LGGLAAAMHLAESEGFTGELIVVAPQWSSSARQRLGLVGERPFQLRAVAASSLSDGVAGVEPDAFADPVYVPVDRVSAHLADAADRALFSRAALALEGLASKHGGAVRGFGRSVELIVLARRVAELRADEGGVMLNTGSPQRSSVRLTADALANAFDELEGNLRKRLNDRRAREGEEGMRTRVIPAIGAMLGLRALQSWPMGGSDTPALDLSGIDSDGRPVLGAARKRLGLSELGDILDATVLLRPALPVLLGDVEPPVRIDAPRLVIAANEIDAAVARVLRCLVLGHDLLEIRDLGRDRGFELSAQGSGEATSISPAEPATRPARRERGSRRGERSKRSDAGEEEPRAAAGAEEPESESRTREPREDEGRGGEGRSREGRDGEGRGRPRRRGRRSRGGERGGDEPVAETASADSAGSGAGSGAGSSAGSSAGSGRGRGRAKPRFEEVSLFDLEDEVRPDSDNDEEGGRSRRRGRPRRRGRRGGRSGEGAEGSDEGSEPAEAGRGKRRDSRGEDSDDGDDDLVAAEEDDLGGALSAMLDEVPDVSEVALPEYDDEEDEEDGEGAPPREDRERRRRAKLEEVLADVPAEVPKPPRRRAAIVVSADRDSIIAAVLLARDIRLLEGIWIYPQSELMTFFRGVATDLRDQTPIYLIGFTPSPARDVIQAASIYRGRISWFDHHDWPPEDRAALQEAIGEEALHLSPGTQTALTTALATCTRRSRFSDKLVDLATGRFTQHDFERWGRLWWWRLGELAKKTGERRADLEPLLAGRPSDLAKEAARVEVPEVPDEVAYLSERDFRLVHFAGYSLVVVSVPEGLDVHLCARIARERYGAILSLAYHEGQETFVLAGEENAGRRGLDHGALVEHLASKLAWVEALAGDDHVARFLLRDAERQPERLDEVIGEIAMGRSILER